MFWQNLRVNHRYSVGKEITWNGNNADSDIGKLGYLKLGSNKYINISETLDLHK